MSLYRMMLRLVKTVYASKEIQNVTFIVSKRVAVEITGTHFEKKRLRESKTYMTY